jgi:acyl-CoA synthetase (AMP-forming)/AMP-acid ligase II
MTDASLLAELISHSAARNPDAIALSYGKQSMSYGELQRSIDGLVAGLVGLGLQRGERIAIYLEKRFETVVASFGATAAGCVFVPLNPLLKAEQVAYIMRDCNVRALLTSSERLALLAPDAAVVPRPAPRLLTGSEPPPVTGPLAWLRWDDLLQAGGRSGHRVIDTDMAAILYTSGSTGKPKGVVLSHRNMVAGAKSVASYLENTADDTLLAALPLSFDAGFSQLTTAFHAGARVVLLNYLLPRDVLKALAREQVTGLTAVPPLYIQLAELDWPAAHRRAPALLRQYRRAHAARNAGQPARATCRPASRI